MRELILIEIIALPAERSRGRHNPRVVKRKMSNFPTKARAAPGPPPCRRNFPTKARAAPGPPPCRRFQYRDHIRIVAPATAGTDPAVAAPKHRRACEARADRHAFWLEHVRAWQASRLSRADYAQRHGLELRSLHRWIARLRHIFRQRGKADASRP